MIRDGRCAVLPRQRLQALRVEPRQVTVDDGDFWSLCRFVQHPVQIGGCGDRYRLAPQRPQPGGKIATADRCLFGHDDAPIAGRADPPTRFVHDAAATFDRAVKGRTHAGLALRPDVAPMRFASRLLMTSPRPVPP